MFYCWNWKYKKNVSLPKFELYWTMGLGSVSLMHLVPTMMVIGQS